MSATVRVNLAAAKRRGDDYVSALQAAGQMVGTVIEVGAEDFHRLTDSAKLVESRPAQIAEWPLGLRLVARKRIAGETGIGDTAARWIGAVGGEKFKLWFHIIFGKDCNCANRQAWLNTRWPYPTN